MAEDIAEQGDAPGKKSKMPMIAGVMLALIGGAGGFYAVWSGLILPAESASANSGSADDQGHAPTEVSGAMPDVAYVPIEPLVISLGDGASGRHLRFRAELEVRPDSEGDVTKLMPRIVDVLNSYLRAVELRDLTDSAALLGLRAQMLRRVQIVTGGGRIMDLLIMEFVLN